MKKIIDTAIEKAGGKIALGKLIKVLNKAGWYFASQKNKEGALTVLQRYGYNYDRSACGRIIYITKGE